MRAGAGSNYPIVTKLEPGTGDIVLGAKRVANGETIWQEITVNGQTGWLNADYIALETRVAALSSSATPTQSHGFTYEEAEEVQVGMTYEQVCSLLGMQPEHCGDMPIPHEGITPCASSPAESRSSYAHSLHIQIQGCHIDWPT